MSVPLIGKIGRDGKIGYEEFGVMGGIFSTSKVMTIDKINQTIRIMSNAQAALAEAVEKFGRIDILLCNTAEGRFS